MSSYLDKGEGLYDPRRMFAVTNWSPEDITVNWREDSGDNFHTLHKGEVKTYPEYLALFVTKALVDREMYRDSAKVPLNPDGSYSKARERAEMAVANKDMRKPYEDKTLQEVREGEESPEVTAMRAKIREELIIEQSDAISNEFPQEEFAEVPKKRGRSARKTESEMNAGV